MSTSRANAEGVQNDKRKGTPNKRWTKEMDNVLRPLLADMARSGLKVDKSFKRQAFVEAANVVNSRFPAACMDAENVENHMRTLKQKYQDIKKLMNLSGVGWNDESKMLILEDETYRTFVEGQPKAKEYLNKPIPFFDELRLVAGDDHAIGDHARTIYHQFGATTLEDESAPPPNTPVDCEPMDTSNQRHEALRSHASKSTARANRRPRNNGDNVASENIGDKLGELAASIKESRKKTWKEKLSDALWEMEGYDDNEMEMVFERLINDKKQAENFYLRKAIPSQKMAR
ncbi:Myb/SANT-like domain-containing protein [Dioscorea alata]|uniref:Myb/SANT-like domain-containing protein n=1 Tax=Dioscorea alata TaxID=55571 RepID=A0ACB7VEE3_DIOAL|nr:Myb/SANT-like domain-containing protein [Dioscorea alata]